MGGYSSPDFRKVEAETVRESKMEDAELEFGGSSSFNLVAMLILCKANSADVAKSRGRWPSCADVILAGKFSEFDHRR